MKSRAHTRRPVAMVVFIGKEFAYTKNLSTEGGGVGPPMKRHMSFCTWTLVSVKPEMLVRLSSPPAQLWLIRDSCFQPSQ